MNNQILQIINKLPSNTVFEITIDWCKAHGLTVSKTDVVKFGKYFKKNYTNHGCSNISTGTDRHNLYKKN